MRKLLISLLLASAAATPALAGPRDFTGRQDARAERQQTRDNARADRQQSRDDARAERSSGFVGQTNVQPSQRPSVERLARIQPTDRPNASNVDAARASRDAARTQRIEQVQQNVDARRQANEQARNLRQQDRPVPNVLRTRVPVVSDTPREGTQPSLRTGSRPMSAPQWSTNWRNNSKYDWQNWRRHHRSWFHLGFYYDPFGWGYYPYQIGWRLWPSYYSSNYWINDPWQYRLPYAPPGYVWIRYWNDALLVDTWTGQVVDMIPGFFW
ncbi:MAG TPA: RcnB family protein [Dehalococcoidia bacterium]|nr:RcnB family protein [Dehalococcoidia bacterium]